MEFTQAIYNSAINQNNELARAFAFGWRDHYIQDQLGDANHLYYDDENLFGPYDNYRRNYGWIDEYLRDELQAVDDYPIQDNAISQMYVNYDLIQDAYEALGDGAPFKTTINANFIAMCVVYDGLILANTIEEWTSAQRSRISLEIISMAGYSYGVNEGFPSTPLSYFDENAEAEMSASEQAISLITEQEKMSSHNILILKVHLCLMEKPLYQSQKLILKIIKMR